MSRFDAALNEYIAACRAYNQALYRGSLPQEVVARRTAAMRELHAAEDPWSDCQCSECW